MIHKGPGFEKNGIPLHLLLHHSTDTRPGESPVTKTEPGSGPSEKSHIYPRKI